MPPEPSADIRELLARGVQSHRAGRLAEAEGIYRRILQTEANHADALHLLGVVSHQTGRHEIAIGLIGAAIALNDRVPAFHNNLANALNAQGKLPEAAAAYGRALTLKPDHVEAHYNLGIVLHTQGRLEEAAASYRRALLLRPNHADTLCSLGNTLQAQGRLDEAVAAYQQALLCRPDHAAAHCNLGNVLKTLGRLDDAAASYARALTYQPQNAEAHNNLGNLLLEQDRPDEAAVCYQRAVSCKPDYAEAHASLGNALKELGRLQEALACYARALELRPEHAEARLGRAIAAIPVFAEDSAESAGATAKFADALDDLTAWDSANPGRLGKSVGTHQPFYLAYRPADVRDLLCRYGDLAGTAAAMHWRPKTQSRPVGPGPRDRARLMIVSGQVRQHPVWDVILRGVIAYLDRRQFEIILYHTSPITDGQTIWASTAVERFVQGPKSTQGWLDEIARDRPDAIFYPEVGMDPVVCLLASLRLAPLQVASWGHPVTTGLQTVDWFLSGELLESAGGEGHYREKLIRLPGTGVCTEPITLQAQPWQGPPRPTNIVRFGVCQQPTKFDPADDVLLTRIAKAVGPCEFWLASPRKLHWATMRLRDRLAAGFEQEGLDPEVYLRVTPWLTRPHFLGFLDEMDVYLDCPAFSGYTTAWQAIHRGVPIVTVEGEFLRQRLASGLLRQIGIVDGVASSRDQYVDTAVRWAHERGKPGPWAARREAIRRAATKADGNRASVSAFGHTVVEALAKLSGPW
jgi:protein O-GlcNAc transferase